VSPEVVGLRGNFFGVLDCGLGMGTAGLKIGKGLAFSISGEGEIEITRRSVRGSVLRIGTVQSAIGIDAVV
jgi:hypothetical protein